MIGFSVDENGRKFMYSGDFSLDSIKVFGEKFLTGDLPRYLKSEPIPHKVGHSALSAAPVSPVMSSLNDGLLCTYLFTCFVKNLVVINVWHYSKIHGVCNWCAWHMASNLSGVLD
jgi:hypothetical protein